MSYESEVKRKGSRRKNSMDPTGQSYLPGYFCPAALIHSRKSTQDTGRVDTGTETTKIIVPQINRSE